MQRYGGINLMPQVGQVGGAYQVPQVVNQANRGQQNQRSSNQKALVGFGHVPKFVPPTYDNVDPSSLPCPDTPSPRNSLISEDEGDYQNANDPNNFNATNSALPNNAGAAQPVIAAARAIGVDLASKPFPPGSFVEYRSRTMQDRWILAKVEAFDEKNQVYKLDVQPKAPMDRVRLRQNGNSVPREQSAQVAAVSPARAGDAVQQNRSGLLHDVVDPFADDGMTMEQVKQENLQLKQKVADLERQLEVEKSQRQQLENQLRGGMM